MVPVFRVAKKGEIFKIKFRKSNCASFGRGIWNFQVWIGYLKFWPLCTVACGWLIFGLPSFNDYNSAKNQHFSTFKVQTSRDKETCLMGDFFRENFHSFSNLRIKEGTVHNMHPVYTCPFWKQVTRLISSWNTLWCFPLNFHNHHLNLLTFWWVQTACPFHLCSISSYRLVIDTTLGLPNL